jgi:hypothetical protein
MEEIRKFIEESLEVIKKELIKTMKYKVFSQHFAV